jgi:hypothetical protein
MSSRRPVRNDVTAAIGGGGMTIPTEVALTVAPSLFSQATSQVEKNLKVRLGLPPDQPLPAQIKQITDSEIKTALATSLSETVKTEVGVTVKGTLKGQGFSIFDERIKTAALSSEHIRGSDDVARILKQKADLMFAKKKAYIDAGFTTQEAMDLMLAETKAKSGA